MEFKKKAKLLIICLLLIILFIGAIDHFIDHHFKFDSINGERKTSLESIFKTPNNDSKMIMENEK